MSAERRTALATINTLQREPSGQTNLGHALNNVQVLRSHTQTRSQMNDALAKELFSFSPRQDSRKVVIVISDGVVQVFCDPDETQQTQCARITRITVPLS